MDWCENFGGPQVVKEYIKSQSLSIEELDEEALLIHSRLARWHKVSAEWILKKLFRCLLSVATLERDFFVAQTEKINPLRAGPSRQRSVADASEEVHCFYCVCVPDVLSLLINEPLKRLGTEEIEPSSNSNSELLLYCLALLLDTAKFVLRDLGSRSGHSEDRVGDATAILRALCDALNRETLYHKQRKYEALPFSILCHAHNCTRSPLIAVEVEANGGPREGSEYSSSHGVVINRRSRSWSRRRRYVLENRQRQHVPSYRWITVLWESFGGNKIWNAKSYSGYDALLELLPLLHRYPMDLNEVALQFLCRALEFSQDWQKSEFVAPCFQYFMQIARRICGEPANISASGDVFLIVDHIKSLSALFGVFLSRDMERRILGFIGKVQKKIRKDIMGIPTT